MECSRGVACLQALLRSRGARRCSQTPGERQSRGLTKEYRRGEELSNGHTNAAVCMIMVLYDAGVI